MWALVTILAILLLAFLALRFNRLWVYRLWDRATRNDCGHLPPRYDLPRYYRLRGGEVDTSVPWPGWDGWYAVVLPEGEDLPVKMARVSLMTGLYGLDGVDSYDRLQLRLSTLDAAEHLALVPTVVRTPGGVEEHNNLSQHYAPRDGGLQMAADRLDVAVSGPGMTAPQTLQRYGRIWGGWPDYFFDFLNPEAGVRATGRFRGERLVWWADLPGLFTYFAAFGTFPEGEVTYRRGTRKDDPHRVGGAEEKYPLRGPGCFEHGFARTLFAADRLFLPVRLLQWALPSFRPLRYHYELFFGEGLRGGFMRARAFGIDVRDRGGLYVGGEYVPVRGVEVAYARPERVAAHCPGRPPTTVYREWEVTARTDAGPLRYRAVREFPPAAVATNMIYYPFTYAGSFRGQAVAGRGYGEYVHL